MYAGLYVDMISSLPLMSARTGGRRSEKRNASPSPPHKGLCSRLSRLSRLSLALSFPRTRYSVCETDGHLCVSTSLALASRSSSGAYLRTQLVQGCRYSKHGSAVLGGGEKRGATGRRRERECGTWKRKWRRYIGGDTLRTVAREIAAGRSIDPAMNVHALEESNPNGVRRHS